jgi:deoxycytidylate deaminase
MPHGMTESPELWESPTKYKYVIHAERNAILYSKRSCIGATLYTTMFPCFTCSQLITKAKIKRVVYFDDKYLNQESLDLFKENSIEVLKLEYEN